MLLHPTHFLERCRHIATMGTGYGIDFETTGLNVHQGAKAFLVGIAAGAEKFSCWALEPHADLIAGLKALTAPTWLRMAAHNAKFELAFLRHQFGIEVCNQIWDTEVMERVRQNNHMSYSLQACALREGLSKYAPMLEWLKVRGNKGRYHSAPNEIIIPYVEQDAWLSLYLMGKEIEVFKHWDLATPIPVKPVVQLEMRTTPMLFELESRGITVDVAYCKEALAFEQARALGAADQFKTLTGMPFVDSRKTLAPVFDSLGLLYSRTEKGNASFTGDVLAAARLSASPEAIQVLDSITAYRDAKKRASSYWENFIEFACADGKVHPNIRQTGAATSRMSVTDPACQTWTDDDENPTPFPIRRAFKPSHPDCLTVSIDWRQMEIVLMMDEADETDRIAEFKQGADFHQRVADRGGVKRSLAKNGRFAKQYGAGVPRIAATLGCSIPTAQAISDAIDETFPKSAAYSRQLINYAKQSGMCYNWLGRRYFFDRGFEYKAPNYRIQGGTGEILRIALCDVSDFLRVHARPETRIVLPIHDELVCDWHKDDLHLVKQAEQIMVNAFKSRKHLDMAVSTMIGPNFFDLKEFKP